tara:strand:- start:317 stop:700 length:384 start_codon:yes stop_codon:yes gene_type:complete
LNGQDRLNVVGTRDAFSDSGEGKWGCAPERGKNWKQRTCKLSWTTTIGRVASRELGEIQREKDRETVIILKKRRAEKKKKIEKKTNEKNRKNKIRNNVLDAFRIDLIIGSIIVNDHNNNNPIFCLQV